jgi:hypothetical protein
VLSIFANISLGYYDFKNGHLIEDLTVSLVPKDGNHEEFNYYLSFDESKFLGLETQDLKFVGKGQMVHGEGENKIKEEFEVEGPVTDFKFSFDIG